MVTFGQKARVAQAYLHARLRPKILRDEEAVQRHQKAHLQRFLRHARQSTAAFKDIRSNELSAFPIMDKARLMANFDRYNTLGLTSSEGWRVHDGLEALPGYSVGSSTGTSGNRGLYVVSDAERYTWLGTMLGKALPDIWRRPARVAIILPRSSRLYDAANESKAITLKFFDLREGLESLPKAVEAFRPNVIVAPPKALVALSEASIDLKPQLLYSAAEVLDFFERALIEKRFGIELGQIYMATEGLFAVSCAHGSLHLAEDVVHFELEPVPGEQGLVSPIITDFTRRTQAMIRYRMNDLLRIGTKRCSCGSPFSVVEEVVGRSDDCFQLPGNSGQSVSITPDVIRNAIIDADRELHDFRVIQTGRNQIELLLPPGPSIRIARSREALLKQLRRLGVEPEIKARMTELTPPSQHKLRRIERKISIEDAA